MGGNSHLSQMKKCSVVLACSIATKLKQAISFKFVSLLDILVITTISDLYVIRSTLVMKAEFFCLRYTKKMAPSLE